MFDPTSFALFLAAALVIAVSPGPGILYVTARTLAGGRAEGLLSSIGTGIGGLFHVAAGALGVSALVMASAEAFSLLKLAGAVWLFWLGWRTIREARVASPEEVPATGSDRAFREGILVEVFNPKTAAFFLAFVPQFVSPEHGSVALQFIVLGTITICLNTLADVVVTFIAAGAREGMLRRPRLMQRIRTGSGIAICSLGAALALARRP